MAQEERDSASLTVQYRLFGHARAFHAPKHEDASAIILRLDATADELRLLGIQSPKSKRFIIPDQPGDRQRIQADQSRTDQGRCMSNERKNEMKEHVTADLADALSLRPIVLVPREIRKFNRWNGVDVGLRHAPCDEPRQSTFRRSRTPRPDAHPHNEKNPSGVYTPDRFGSSPIAHLLQFS